MGGIAGIQYIQNFQKENIHNRMTQMLGTIKHRAPQSQINDSHEGICFGANYHPFETLSQSMAYSETSGILVVVDGAILKDTRNTVQKTSKCFAQTVLELYKKSGEAFLEQIDGVYAMAVWDGRQNKMFLIRDRVGARPLFYTRSQGGTIFGSEIKAVLASGFVDRSIDLNALNQLLTYWYVPNPGTLFDSINQVRPGHYLVIQNDKMIEKQYWRFKYNQTGKIQTESYYKEKFYDLFSESVSRCLKCYPESGSFLSGGLDSSSVVAAMHELNPKPFKVFTGGFKEKKYNESSDAKIVADHIGAEFFSIILEFNDDFPALLEKLVWHHDAPFCDTSAIPSYFASKLAKEHVHTVLTGDFPDQLIGGSGHYIGALDREKNDTVFDKLLRMRGFSHLIRKMPWSSSGISLYDRAKRMVYRKSYPIDEQRIIFNMPVPELLKRCLYSSELLKVNMENDPMRYARSLYKEVEDHDLLDRLLYFDIHSYAPDDLMVKVDRMTSAHGLIPLSPFHDKALIEFIATLPSSLKIKGNERKYIMKEAMKPLLPEHTLVKKKKGFDMPIEEWLIKRHPDFVRDILFDSRTVNRGLFKQAFLSTMVENFLNKKTDYASGSAATIISLITLELWHRIFIDEQ